MGNCNSCKATQVATAKLILHDGKLEEFAIPVTVSQVICSKKMNPRRQFICSADEMDFNAYVKGLSGKDILELGQLYFVLPVSALKEPLQADQMAALAVKASSALKNRGRCMCVQDLVFPMKMKRFNSNAGLGLEQEQRNILSVIVE